MSTISSSTPARILTLAAVHALGLKAQATASALSKFTRITGAGVFYWPTQPSFWDAWKEHQQDGSGSLTIRMGRLELIADWRAQKPA